MNETERVIRMLKTHASHNEGFLQLNVNEVRTLVDLLGVRPSDQEMLMEPVGAVLEETVYDVEIKTIGELLDQLCIENLKIWHLVDKAHAGDETVQKDIQDHNDIRRDLVRALDRRLGERDIGGRV